MFGAISARRLVGLNFLKIAKGIAESAWKGYGTTLGVNTKIAIENFESVR